MPGLTFIPLHTDNNRISALQERGSRKNEVTVITFYMLYFNGSADQITEYGQTLKDVQCIIDNNDPSPIIFLGDINASLPQKSKLCRNWHRQHPFNNSLLLYDFIHQNYLSSCNFYYKQQIDYTNHRIMYSVPDIIKKMSSIAQF